MRSFFTERTKTTPRVDLNAETGELEIIGECYPENAMPFYKPIFEWLNDYLCQSNTAIIVNLRLAYFNTSTSKCLLNLLEILEQAHLNGRQIELNWHYQENDEDMLDSGYEFAEDITLPFNFLAF
jgi:hypothetical protein